jgi:hypothetical protein
VYRFLLFFYTSESPKFSSIADVICTSYTSESPKFSSIADVICTSVRLKVMARNLQNLGLPKSEGYPT